MCSGRRSLPGGLFAAALFAVLCLGCSKSSKPVAPGGGNPAGADSLVELANAELEQILSALITSPTDAQRPSDVNFSAAEQLYRSALALDGANLDAHFGLSVLELLALSYDSEVNAAFDEWKVYLQTHTPFEARATRLRPLGVPITPTAGLEALRLPFELVPMSLVAQMRSARIANDPQLSRVQAILETRVLPKLTSGIAHLAVVAANPGYTFIVTPLMQGNPSATPIEIDRTDVLALRAGASLLAAACHVAVSYELGFATYDSTGLVQSFQQGSGWLALRTGGASHMGEARTSLFAAIDGTDATIVSLLAEVDDQDDDVIKIGPDARSRAEAESLRAQLPLVRSSLNSGYTRIDDWDSNPATPDVALTIRPDRLFTNPVPDWKALFPAYQASALRRPLARSYPYREGLDTVTVDIAVSGSYYGSYAKQVYSLYNFEYYSGDEVLHAALAASAVDQVEAISHEPGYTGEYYVNTSFNGALAPGLQSIVVTTYTSWVVATRSAFVPVITWDAASYAEWTWPDPSMHGLLPQMTSNSQLLSTFGYPADQWTRQVVLDWTQFVRSPFGVASGDGLSRHSVRAVRPSPVERPVSARRMPHGLGRR
jgi:hypothetical protein